MRERVQRYIGGATHQFRCVGRTCLFGCSSGTLAGSGRSSASTSSSRKFMYKERRTGAVQNRLQSGTSWRLGPSSGDSNTLWSGASIPPVMVGARVKRPSANEQPAGA